MIRYQQCPVCDSAGIHKVLKARDHTVSGNAFEIWQCANCSLRFTQDAPGPNEIGAYYKSDNYISHTEISKGIINRLYLFVRSFTLSSKRKFIEQETGLKKGSLLDLGAGTGAFLDHMQQAGWVVQGLEPDEQAVSRAHSRYGLDLKPTRELYALAHSSFDAITLWHVLEHLHELHDTLSQLKKLLKPGGKLFIAVPNYTSMDAERYGAWWAAYDVPRHLYHFSPASMKVLMDRHGLTIQRLQPMWFDSFYVSLLSEKYKSGFPNLFNGFLHGIRSNSKALSNKRRASSVIYVLTAGHLPA